MKHHLARIRKEAAVEYAVRHPKVRLEDIGLALGWGKRNARVVVSKLFRAAGNLRRK